MMGGAKRLATSLLVLLLAAAALIPLLPTTYSQSSPSFAVTTNKSVYDTNDRIIVAGTITFDDNGDGRIKFVVIKITKEDLTCGQQSARIERDGSFISHSLKVLCGLGNYNVTASFGTQSTTAGFLVAHDEAIQSTELTRIRDSVTQARDKVTTRIKELVNADYPIPTTVVEKYQLGASEASLAIQSANYGETASAHKHADKALGYLTETLDLLSSEKLGSLSQLADVDENMRRIAAAIDKYDRITDIYHTLVTLAEKNHFSDVIFDEIHSLLVEAKRLVDTKDANSAESTLALTESMMDKVRVKLVEQVSITYTNNPHENNSHVVKAPLPIHNPRASNLSGSADRMEERDKRQLELAGANTSAQNLIREAMNFLNSARTAIDDGQYQYARGYLSNASKSLSDAEKLIHSI